jgi:diacylglycerol kinase (ATP)
LIDIHLFIMRWRPAVLQKHYSRCHQSLAGPVYLTRCKGDVMQEPPSYEPGLDPANESPFKGKTGLRRIVNALQYSLDGLQAAYRCEDAFRQEVWLALVLIPATFLLPVPWLGRALMVGSVLLVLVVELLNSAIEAVVDRVGLENHRLAKRAKDIGSAAVLVALLNVLAIWGCVGMAVE